MTMDCWVVQWNLGMRRVAADEAERLCMDEKQRTIPMNMVADPR